MAIVTLDRVMVTKLLAENGSFVFAPERHAIQLIGCKGDVIAHIPLTHSQLALVLE